MNTNNTRYMCKFLLYYVLHETTIFGIYQHQLQESTNSQCKTQHAYLNTNQDVRNPTLKYKTQLVDINKSFQLYQQSITIQVHQLCTTCHLNLSHQYHHPNMIYNFVTDPVYMIIDLQTFLNFNNKTLAFSSNFTLVSHD